MCGGRHVMVYLTAAAWAGIVGMIAGSGEARWARVSLGLLAVLPFCLVAGLRARCVGIDVQTYAIWLYYAALDTDFPSFMSFGEATAIEPLFSVVTWVATALFGSLNFNLFLYQALVVVPILFSLLKLSPRNIGIALVVYGLLYFPFSLNIMRQSISAAFLLVACAYALEKRYATYAVCMVLSIAFHLTGLLGLIIIAVVELCRRYKCAEDELQRGRSAKILCLCVLVAVAIYAALLVFGRRLLPLLKYIKPTYAMSLESLHDAGPVLTVLVLGIVFGALYGLIFVCKRKGQAPLELTPCWCSSSPACSSASSP